VLDLADIIRIGAEFSPAEQNRARAAAARDPRLREALEAAGYGLTQTLAAAPQLVARWEDAQAADPYAWAVLTAALDAARLGARAPLTAGFLRDAAPGYCTSAQQAEAPGNWFEQALAFATGKLHGAAAPLSPAGIGMGQVAGYTAADYLVQHASRKRHSARVPASTWDAVLRHVRDPADAMRLADSARCRLLYRYAIPLYRHAADAGDGLAARRLADLLTQRGDLGELRALAEAGDRPGAAALADLLAERGDLDGAAQILRDLAETGDEQAGTDLARLLARRGNLGELRALAEAGDRPGAAALADLLAERGDLDELRGRVDADDAEAAWRLAILLAERGELGEAAQILRERSAVGAGYTPEALVAFLVRFGDPGEAAQILRNQAEAGDGSTAALVDLLAQRGDLDELRARADAGDRNAAWRLADLLAERGDLDGVVQILQDQAEAGDEYAALRLTGLLAERGDLDGLRVLADIGEGAAASELARLLAERNDLEELRALADDVGYIPAAWRLADLLAQRGDLEELRVRTDAGDWYAGKQLVDLLTKQDQGDEPEQLRRFGLNPDGSTASA